MFSKYKYCQQQKVATIRMQGEVGDGSLSTSSSSNALDAFEQIAIASEANTVKPAVVQPPMIIPTDDNGRYIGKI